MLRRQHGLTKQYGVPILAGEALARRLEGFALFEIDRVRVVGREAPESIFALLGDETMGGDASFARMAEAHSAMLQACHAQDWDRAEAALAAGRPDYEANALAGLHNLVSQRIASLREHPPGEDWDGVFQATQK